MRVFLKVAYDGTTYHGWQYQNNQPTVEGELLKAIEQLVGEAVEIIGASRTDAGVHALGNIAVFDTNSSIPANKFSFALNNILPEDIKIVESKKVPNSFNPRFDVKNKTYEYRILNSQVMLPTHRLYSYNYYGKLDLEAMKKAAKYIEGEHDFTSLASVHAQVQSYVRTVFLCEVIQENNTIIIRVNGSGFLYNMVRIIAGTLLEVGRGKIKSDEVKNIIESKDRSKGGPTLPPQGLMLTEINY